MTNAALTIVSKNYISFARTLAESFHKHNQDCRFFVILVDEESSQFSTEEHFELINVRDIPIPGGSAFLYQYSILELNTAVKPFALSHIFEKYNVDKLLYIDPDICFFSDGEPIWRQLQNHDILLTPHLLSPYNDQGHPSDKSILQSGTYNLGFIGLRKSIAADALLDWWGRKLEYDCVVDIPNGLFTDQKWIDLVPGFFNNVCIDRDPGLNVAYWNLHERRLIHSENHTSPFVQSGEKEVPLIFFHFSGYNPKKSERLSKHQNRHEIHHYPELEAAYSYYKNKLFQHGLEETSDYSYAFGLLPSGIPCSPVVQKAIRTARRAGCSVTSALSTDRKEAGRFFTNLSFETSPHGIPLIQQSTLELRPDITKAFPGMQTDPGDNGFWNWMESNYTELGLDESFGRVTKPAEYEPYDLYRFRADLQETFPNAFFDEAGGKKFRKWLKKFGVKESQHLSRSAASCWTPVGPNSYIKCWNLYFARLDIMETWPNLGNSKQAHEFCNWLRQNIHIHRSIRYEEICEFEAWILRTPELSALRCICGSPTYWKELHWFPNAFSYNRICTVAAQDNVQLQSKLARNYLYDSFSKNPLLHLLYEYSGRADLQRIFPLALTEEDQFQKLVHTLMEEASAQKLNLPSLEGDLLDSFPLLTELKLGINIVGYFDASTGMGASGRSTAEILEAGGHPVTKFKICVVGDTLPDSQYQDVYHCGMMNPVSSVTVWNVNADMLKNTRHLVPRFGLSPTKNVAVWVWESNIFRNLHKRELVTVDEIWSPSTYSAASIAAVTELPVHVVPHMIASVEVAASPKSSLVPSKLRKSKHSIRSLLGLPDDVKLVAYFFDPRSVPERKNPMAALQIFEAAFGGRNDVVFVMKSNGRFTGYDAEMLIQKYNTSQYFFVSERLDEVQIKQLFDEIDAYVSPHRAEGFGLTIAEAMASGIPVVTHRHTGPMDFIPPDYPGLVGATPVKLATAVSVYPANTVWYDIDVEAGAKVLGEFIDNRGDYAEALEAAGTEVKTKLSARQIYEGSVSGLFRD